MPLLGAVPAPGATVAELAAPVITEKGAHHRVWSRTTITNLPNGRVRTNTTSYTELATGLHRWDAQAGQWAEASDEIELFQDGAVARKAAHSLIFAPNIATAGSIDLQLPDGRRWLTHVEGLALYDPDTQQGEIIAEIKDCVGELHAPNTVIYPDAFDSMRAAVRYTHTRDRFEQDVILWERIELPAGFGPRTRLEIWTEIVASPEHTKTTRQLGALTDDRLDFGCMQIGSGRAFMLEDPQGNAWTVPMAKTVVVTPDTRRHLVEAVEFTAIQAQLNTLPAPQHGAAVRPPSPLNGERAGVRGEATMAHTFPKRAQPAKPVGKIQMAAVGRVAPRAPTAAVQGTPDNPQSEIANRKSSRGLVLDYTLVSTTNNFTFKGDTTYFIQGATLSGTNILEGGAVLKFGGVLTLTGPLECRTASYLPAILTSYSDDTVGEVITGYSTGNPWTNYAASALLFDGTSVDNLKHLRFSHVNTAVAFDYDSSGERDFGHIQFVHCRRAFELVNATVRLRNVLMVDVATNFAAHNFYSGTVRGEHVTIFRTDKLADTNGSVVATIYLTNSLLVAVTNTAAYSGANNASNSEPSAVFQTVGAGMGYLLDNTYRNAGTTNIHTNLLTEIRQRTTYPPTVLSGWSTVDATLAPHVQRDTDLPDLGWHYDALDYVWTSVVHSNATLTIAPGTAIGIAAANGGYGFAQYDASTVVGNGTAASPIRIARHNCVQEQSNTNWLGIGDTFLPSGFSSISPNAARFAFTIWTAPAYSGAHVSGSTGNPASLGFWDCQFFGGMVATYRPALRATNCLFHRTVFWADDGDTQPLGLTFRHCTFTGGSLEFIHGNSDAWTFRDNLFDGINNSFAVGDVTNDFNGYVTNSVCSRFTPNAANDTVTNVAPAYESGAVGRYYLPTNVAFINTGSTNAHLLGFYHYTTLTNQTKELTNRLDLGFHYVSLNGTSIGSTPADGDSDSFADYFEDLDGDGVVDASETDWSLYTTRFGVGPGPGLIVFTPLK